MHRKPLVIVPADRKMIGKHAFHSAGEKYLSALVSGSDVIPFVLPSLSPTLPLREILENIDGLFLTGSHSISSRIIIQMNPVTMAICTTGIVMRMVCRSFRSLSKCRYLCLPFAAGFRK